MTSATQPTLAGHRVWRWIITFALVTAMVLTGIVVVQRREQAVTNRPGGADAASALTAQEQLSVYARAHGLSGLSPASLSRPAVQTSGVAHEVSQVPCHPHQEAANAADLHTLYVQLELHLMSYGIVHLDKRGRR